MTQNIRLIGFGAETVSEMHCKVDGLVSVSKFLIQETFESGLCSKVYFCSFWKVFFSLELVKTKDGMSSLLFLIDSIWCTLICQIMGLLRLWSLPSGTPGAWWCTSSDLWGDWGCFLTSQSGLWSCQHCDQSGARPSERPNVASVKWENLIFSWIVASMLSKTNYMHFSFLCFLCVLRSHHTFLS